MDIFRNWPKLLQISILLFCLLTFASCDVEDTDTPAAAPAADVNSIDALDENKCSRKRRGCCEQLFIEEDDALTKCFALHMNKMPKEDEKDPAKLLKFMSCLVECIYKQKKYIGKGDNINMKMVKNDAEKIYHDRPKEKEYHIAMFEHCRKDAVTKYSLIKTNPAGRVLLKDACKPYFIFVFLCEAEYHKTKTCPYFRWEGAKSTRSETDCKDAKDKCYEIDGLPY